MQIMRCSEGYLDGSPLCSVCDEGYGRTLGRCSKCTMDGWGYLSISVVVVIVWFPLEKVR